MTKLYISGPMTGRENLNYAGFAMADMALRYAGYEVVNPWFFEANHGKTWAECLRYDLTRMFECDAVAVLDDWQESDGANLEVYNAVQVEMTVDTVEGWIAKAFASVPRKWTVGLGFSTEEDLPL